MPTVRSTRYPAVFITAAVALVACSGSPQEAPSVPPVGRITAAEVIRNTDDSYHLRWSVAPVGARVAVFASTDPAHIPRDTAVAETAEVQATVTGLDPDRRYYFDLVPEGGDGYIVAPRFVHLEGASNFRDLGGYETADGRRVRWGSVYRSDELTDLTDADVRFIGEMGLQVVCDLRRASRRETDPDRLPTQDPPAVLALDISAASGTGGSPISEWGDAEAASRFADGYARRIRRAGSLYGEMLDELADQGNRPFLFHCQGGKDRAGTAAALLLLALGVSEDTVLEDYLLTNEAYAQTGFDPVARATEIGVSVAVLEVLRSARPVFLQAAFDEMTALSGSIDEYLRQELDLTDTERDRLRSELLY